jgi:hypothetical protein
MTIRARLVAMAAALSMLTGLVLVPGAAGAAQHGRAAGERELVAGEVVGSPQPVSLTSDLSSLTTWSVPDGKALVSVSRTVDGRKVADLAFTNGSSSSDMPGIRLPGVLRDVTFGPDATAYLTVAQPDDQTAGWLLRLGRADSFATVLHTWLVDPVERYREPYSVEYANDRLFVEALSANVFFGCMAQLETFDLAGASVGTFEATSCGGAWQADDGLVFASDAENRGGLFVDSATGESHRVAFPSFGPIWNLSHGRGGRIAVVTGGGHVRCETGYVSVIDPSGVLLSRPLHEVFGVASDSQCLVRALTLLDDGSAVLGADLPGIGASLFVVAPDGSSNQIWTSEAETISSLHAAAGNAFVMISTSVDGCGLPHLESCEQVHVAAGTELGVMPLTTLGGEYGNSRRPIQLAIGGGAGVLVTQRNQCVCSDPDNEYVMGLVVAPGTERQGWHDPAGESEPTSAIQVTPTSGVEGDAFSLSYRCPAASVPRVRLVDEDGNAASGARFGAPVSGNGSDYAQSVELFDAGMFRVELSCGDIRALTETIEVTPASSTVLFIQGIGSSSTCEASTDFVGKVGWLKSGLESLLGPDTKFLYYAYRSSYTTNPGCTDSSVPQYQKLDSCLSLDDQYARSVRRVEAVPDGGQATRLSSFLRTYLDSHPGETLSIVAHSQGAVLASYAVKERLVESYTRRIRAIVAYDSPLRGINEAAIRGLRRINGCQHDPSLDSAFDMDPDSAVIQRINDETRPDTKLYTVDAVPGTLERCRLFCPLKPAFVDDFHSGTSWETAHIQVLAITHDDIWKGCFADNSLCPEAGPDFNQQGRRLVRFTGCAVGRLADDCVAYSDQ